MLTNTWKIGTKVNACDDAKLSVKLRRPEPGRPIQLSPATTDEPLYRAFRCNRVTVKHGRARHSASTGDIVVTATRVLLLLRRGPTGKGAENFTVVSVGRDELRAPNTKTDRHDKVTALELVTSDGSGSISIPSLREPFAALIAMLAPESAERLGPAAAAARRQAKLEEEEKRREAERKAKEEKAENAAREFQARLESPHRAKPVTLTAGGMLDHRRTWHYRVAASEDQCVRAFVNAFSGGGGVLLRAKWDVREEPGGAAAVYKGRKGIIAAGTLFSQTASAEQEGALGSEIKFEILGQDGDHTICTMWLASRASRMGFTNDARFFRPYMRTVETELRRLDPSAQIIKE
jgi:hypothetical protein